MELELKRAILNSTDKQRTQWPSRKSLNRLEPQCWPELRPKFQLERNSKVFTIGSCFARNIEQVLADLGFDIPAFSFFSEYPNLFGANSVDIMNRYTPPSIFQELAWTQKIMDRDDTVNQDDIEPFLLEAENDRVYDLGRIVSAEYGITREQALAERKLFYGLYRTAFNCDAMIMTLGFIECWKDVKTGMYVELSRGVLRNPERFSFERIDYTASLDYIKRAIGVVRRDRPIKVLLTTSPVPLARTFTGDDVIVANMYSKSVLRAVAGAVADTMDEVDYFPSFENVMLTKERSVWMDDLRHVERDFVGSIMLRVVSAYVPAALSKPEEIESMYRFTSFAKSGDWAQASALFDKLRLEELPQSSPEFFIYAAELASMREDPKLAREMAERAPCVPADLQLRCARALEAVGLHELGAERRLIAAKFATLSLDSLSMLFHVLDHSQQRDDIEWLLGVAEDRMELSASTAWSLACMYERIGRRADVERLLRFVIATDPSNEDVGLKLAHLLLNSERRKEGLSVLRALLESGSTNIYLYPLVSEDLRCGRPLEAKAILETLISTHPEHDGLLQLAAECDAAEAALERNVLREETFDTEQLEVARRNTKDERLQLDMAGVGGSQEEPYDDVSAKLTG